MIWTASTACCLHSMFQLFFRDFQIGRVFPIKIQFISRFYIRPSFFKFNTLLFSISIRFSTSSFVSFNLDIPFLSSTFVLSKCNVRYLGLTFGFSSATFVYWRRFIYFYASVTFVFSLSFVFHLTSFVFLKQMTKSSRVNKTNAEL